MSSPPEPNTAVAAVLASPATRRRRSWRLITDRLVRHAVGVGGVSVIGAIVLIFFYLLYVVFPLFLPARMQDVAAYPAPGRGGASLHLALEEQAEVGVRFTDEARAVFFRTTDGRVIDNRSLVPGSPTRVASLVDAGPDEVALGFEDGRVLLVRPVYDVSYPNDRRLISPRIEYPLGPEPLDIGADGRAPRLVAVRDGEEGTLVAAYTQAGGILMADFRRQSSLLEEGALVLERAAVSRICSAPSPICCYRRIGAGCMQQATTATWISST